MDVERVFDPIRICVHNFSTSSNRPILLSFCFSESVVNKERFFEIRFFFNFTSSSLSPFFSLFFITFTTTFNTCVYSQPQCSCRSYAHTQFRFDSNPSTTFTGPSRIKVRPGNGASSSPGGDLPGLQRPELSVAARVVESLTNRRNLPPYSALQPGHDLVAVRWLCKKD